MRKSLLCILFFLLYINSFSQIDFYPTPNSFIIPEYNIIIFPESERPLNFVILGNDARDFISIKNESLFLNSQVYDIQKELWMLCFEIKHGRIINALPDYTVIYFAIKDDREKSFFNEYLIKRCGFKKEEIKKRIKFFKIPSPCLWTQDTGEIIGKNKNGNIILINNNQDSYGYVLNSLFKFYNKSFIIKTFDTLSVEGGDIEIAWNVKRNGAIIFLGRHRILEYLRRKENKDFTNISLFPEQIDEIRKIYKEYFFNIPVEVIPEKMLLQPSIAENELFHLDMVVTFLSNDENVYAFIPFYEKENGNFDIVLRKPLVPEFIKKLNCEYDAVAEQLKNFGYEVVRIPIFDHPVRSPVNIIKFMNKKTGKQTILLGKYPYYNKNLPIEMSPYSKIDNSLFNLEDAIKEWESNKTDFNYNNLMQKINIVWRVLSQEYSSPNPDFEKQKSIYTKYGFEVIEVPICASGSGGLHCTALY